MRGDATRSGRPPRAPPRRQSPSVSGALGPGKWAPAGGSVGACRWGTDGTALAPVSSGRAGDKRETRAGPSLELERRVWCLRRPAAVGGSSRNDTCDNRPRTPSPALAAPAQVGISGPAGAPRIRDRPQSPWEARAQVWTDNSERGRGLPGVAVAPLVRLEAGEAPGDPVSVSRSWQGRPPLKKWRGQ